MEASPLVALALLAVLAAGCVAPSQDPTPSTTAPSATTPAAACQPVAPKASTVTTPRQDTVSNNPGSFSDSGQMVGATGTDEYAWQDASGQAMISWGGQAASGSMKLTLLDACGKSVYSQTFEGMSQGGGNQNAKPGVAGQWLVRLEFTGFTGQMGLSVTG